jgi:hypothetical protein
MKPFLLLIASLAVAHSSFAAPKAAVGRTIREIDIIPASVLQRSVSAKFYKSLLASPIQGYVLVRAQLSGTKLSGLKVLRSEPNNANDHLALQRASEVQIAGNNTIESPNAAPSVLVHLLLYEIADGTMALSFAHVDSAGGNQMEYFGSARLAVLKHDGKWVEIKGPAALEGKGIAVRQGSRSDLSSTMKLERMGAEAVNYGTGATR